jgi:CheY-like chemotaxis protein
MVPLHAPNPSSHPTGGGDTCAPNDSTPGGCRLNLLLSYGGWQPESWVDVLPRLLEPMGVRAVRACSGREAAQFIQRTPVHIAVVDLSLPLEPCTPIPATPRNPFLDDADDLTQVPEEGGERIIELLQRLESPPPTVIVKRRRTGRENARALSKALMSGAFAVLEPPVNIELALEVMRRVLQRHYAGRWPAA